jgi:Predicted nucleotide-binding protein containing TIR-like domain
MERLKRVFVSAPRDHHLDERQQILKHSILDKLRSKGLEPQEFHVSGLALRSPYTFDAVRDIMARCHGALILAFARWRDPSGGEQLAMPTVWNHFEGAFAVALKKEILVITEEKVAADGITSLRGGQIVLTVPTGAGPEWLEAGYTKPQIDAWVDVVKRTKDVFLAYSSKARATANDIQKFLSDRGVSVLDWEIHFASGSTILDELLLASRTCLGAIMLLTKDDNLLGEENYAAPRDNVIFEMGLFMEAKGRERVLVIREEGAKMPADIGGGIYLSLRDRNDIAPIQMKLLDFIEKRI